MQRVFVFGDSIFRPLWLLKNEHGIRRSPVNTLHQ